MSAVFRPTRMRISVDRYQKMVETGVLTQEDRVELIEGEIVDMAPIGKMHSGVVNALAELLTVRLAGRATVAVAGPINLGDFSEPQPDLALLKRRSDFYRGKLPEASDALLVVEVADSSLAYDLTAKARLYARYGIGEYWVLDANARRAIVQRAPQGEAYSQVLELNGDAMLSPSAFPDIELALRDLFGEV